MPTDNGFELSQRHTAATSSTNTEEPSDQPRHSFGHPHSAQSLIAASPAASVTVRCGLSVGDGSSEVLVSGLVRASGSVCLAVVIVDSPACERAVVAQCAGAADGPVGARRRSEALVVDSPACDGAVVA